MFGRCCQQDGSAFIELRPKYPRIIEAQEEHGSISSSDDLDELAFVDGFSHGRVSTSVGVSKWQLKGKRNNRNLGKRSLDRTDAEVSRAYMTGRNSNWTNNGIKAVQLIKVLVPIYPANNYRRDVPMISLMSKLNGHAIVGHPIQIEALESGLSENLLSATDYFIPEPLESPTALPSAWKTGRRTANFRVPRPFLSSTLSGDSKQHAQSLMKTEKLNVDQIREASVRRQI
ncbi:UNVERIFIED_CONTAM: hypothetical protein Sradi_6322200 [Sesamum radiatum]|uniref:Uncharacterized protein n=1 Tax=Sesamum radiatum TaxID=300843 RepID=A0AAW2KF18_SESRA